MAKLAREHRLHLVVAALFRAHAGTLYCTVLFFGDAGTFLGKHRKLMPDRADTPGLGIRRRSTLRRSGTRRLGRLGQ